MYREKEGVSQNSNIVSIVADTVQDVFNLEKQYPMGSKCYVIGTSETYMLNSRNEWILQPVKGEEQINSVKEMKLLSPTVGDKINTIGFYEVGDGGGASYLVEESGVADDLTVFALANGSYAHLIVYRSMNVVQFGARAFEDVNNYKAIPNIDSTNSLQAAVDSTATIINFPQSKKFLYRDTVIVNHSNKIINGNDSTIYTDNEFNTVESAAGTMIIQDTDNIQIRRLNFFSLQTIDLGNTDIHLVVLRSSDVIIDSCVFRGPGPMLTKGDDGGIFETDEYLALAPDIGWSNIDLFTGWHNVTITNCELYISHDGPFGNSILIRDIQNRGASGLTFANNYAKKICHDEILAIGMIDARLSDISIYDNTFIMYDGVRTSSVLAVTIGTDTTTAPTSNVRIDNNFFDLQATVSSILIENLDGEFSFKGNTVNGKKGKGYESGEAVGYVYIETKNSNVVNLENNNLNVDGSDPLLPIANVFKGSMDITGNIVRVKGNVENTLATKVNKFNDNIVLTQGSIRYVFDNVYEATNNEISCTNFVNFVRLVNAALDATRDLSGNTIELTDNVESRLVYANSGTAYTQDATLNLSKTKINMANDIRTSYIIQSDPEEPTPVYILLDVAGSIVNAANNSMSIKTVFSRISGISSNYIKY